MIVMLNRRYDQRTNTYNCRIRSWRTECPQIPGLNPEAKNASEKTRTLNLG